MSHPFRLGGIIAGLVLIAFGLGAIVIGLAGRHEVSTDVKREQIVGTPDMKPSVIAQKVKEAGLQERRPADAATSPARRSPTARGQVLRQLHAHPRPRGDRRQDLRPDAAVRDRRRQGHRRRRRRPPRTPRRGQPQANQARQVWINETALSTALNTSFFAASVGLFAIVMGARAAAHRDRLPRPRDRPARPYQGSA